jgi:biotin transport system substrate-specific component
MINQRIFSCLVSTIAKKIYDWQLDYLVVLPIVFSIASQIIIPLPFSAVPISLQPLPILLAAWFLGIRGVAGYAVYLLDGALGLPIFSGFSGGLLHLLGPTGGYLSGFLLSAFVISIARKYVYTSLDAYLLYTCAMIITFLFGIAQLSSFVPMKLAVLQGFVPFIIGDFVLKPAIFILATMIFSTSSNKH